MTAEAHSIISKKAGNRQPAKARSAFSPAMIEEVCDEIAASLTGVFRTRSEVLLESVGVEPSTDLIEALVDDTSAALVEMNGIRSAVLICFDGSLAFHATDILLGGDAESEAIVSTRPATTLDDRFTGSLAEAVIRAFTQACNQSMGPGTVDRCALVAIEHDKREMEIAPGDADVLCIRTSINIGQAGRTGTLEIHIPLTTIDLISSGGSSVVPSLNISSGPWFDHMRESILEMELETIGILHTEKMSVAQVSRFDIGTVLVVPGKAIEDVPLVLEDGGDQISTGELGSSSGHRIIRLAAEPNRDFLGPIELQ